MIRVVRKTPNSHIVYLINQEERTIVAVLEGTAYDVLQQLNKRVAAGIGLGLKQRGYGGLGLKDTYKGIAKCHPNDLWDEEVGREIAKQRALAKYRRHRVRVLSEWLQTAEQRLSEIASLEQKWVEDIYEDDFNA